MWDPSGLSSEKLIIPLNFFHLFQFLDGEHSPEQIGVEYLKKYGEFMMPDKLDRLIADLDQKLFLEGDRYEAAKAAAVTAYREAPTRKPRFAGKSYEADPQKLREQLAGFFTSKEGPGPDPSDHQGKLIKGLVVPNYEVNVAGPLYAWAYKTLREAEAPDVYILFGTAHAGLAEPVAVTDKDSKARWGSCRSIGLSWRLYGPKEGTRCSRMNCGMTWNTASNFSCLFFRRPWARGSPSLLFRSCLHSRPGV